MSFSAEEDAETGHPATLNRNVPLKQLDGMGMGNGKVSNLEEELQAGGAALQQKGTSAPSECRWGAMCLLT